MSELTSYNVQRLLSSIRESFEFNDNNYKAKAIEAIGRGLEILQLTTSFTPTSKTVTVENNRFTLPCTIETLDYIEYNCQELPLINATNFVRNCPEDYPASADAYGELHPPYIHTSFQNGEVTIFYTTFNTDADGFPTIPDNGFVSEALEWYVVYKLILSGYKHHSIKSWQEAYQMWERLYPRAQNNSNFPSYKTMERFLNVWTSAISSTNFDI